MSFISELIAYKIASILPKVVIYQCVIRMWARTTMGEYSDTNVQNTTVLEILERWQLE